jgi:hypothetical protein
MALSKELIEILACPKCKGPLTQVETPAGFACPECNLLYKTEDDIPNFLISEAKAWKEEQKSE